MKAITPPKIIPIHPSNAPPMKMKMKSSMHSKII